MLKNLTEPSYLFARCGRLIPWCVWLSVLTLGTGWIWGFGFAPADGLQGQSYRIIYLHVPAASGSMAVYALMAVMALGGLLRQNLMMANLSVAAMAPVGATFALIALLTGAVWGKPAWGTWWVWDARLTSELILLFLYIGAMALWNAIDDPRLASRAVGLLVLTGMLNLPIIHYSVEWWNTLHQGSTRLQQSIDPSMRKPLRLSMLGFLCLFLTLALMRLRNLILLHERYQPWAQHHLARRERP